MITVITGPPCSGKSTYALAHVQPGDVLVDFDALAVALGSPDAHEHPQRLRVVTLDAWCAAVGSALQAPGHGDTWIVDSRPTGYRVGQYRAAGAHHVPLDVGAAELHRRADADGRTAYTHDVIAAWGC